jgi:hypothetical protein
MGSLHRQRCDELAASLSAAEEGRKATQLQLEEALRDVIGVKTQLQGSMERDAAACARASVLEAQLAVSDAAASVELDRVRRNHAQECEGLKELLSVERDRSAQAAIDLDSHVTTSRRRCEELEQALQASRDECDNTRRELETVLRSSSFSNNSADNSSSFSSNSADDEDNGVRNVRRYMSPASRRQYPRPNHVVRE